MISRVNGIEVTMAGSRPERSPAVTGRKSGPSRPWKNASLHFYIPAGDLSVHALSSGCALAQALNDSGHASKAVNS